MSSTGNVAFTTVGPADGSPALLLAEFDTPAACMHCAEKLRDEGFTKFDAHTPFPVHGMDRAMGLRDSRLGWIVFAMALTGFSTAVFLMWYMNFYDYAFVVGGKPPFSIPSMAPVCFELTVLFSAFGAVFGMLGLNKLPRHHHPIFESDRFRAVTDDKFFISVECADPKYDAERTRRLVESAHPNHIEIIEDNES
jgi:hypothetical protein